jgi:hypothetical protein
MKKAFLLLIAVMALAGVMWFNASASGTPSIEVTVYSEFFTDAKPGAHVPAGLYTADENLEELPCAATENPGYISCQIPESYAGQQELLIQLTKNDIMFTELVSVPAK